MRTMESLHSTPAEVDTHIASPLRWTETLQTFAPNFVPTLENIAAIFDEETYLEALEFTHNDQYRSKIEPFARSLDISFYRCLEVLQRHECQVGIKILPAIKFIMNIYGQSIDQTLLHHQNDVFQMYMLLKSGQRFEDYAQEFDDREAYSEFIAGLEALNILEYAFYNTVQMQPHFIPYHDRLYDADWTAFVMQRNLSKGIWQFSKIDPSQTPLRQAQSLYRYTRSMLRQFYSVMQRDLNPRENIKLILSETVAVDWRKPNEANFYKFQNLGHRQQILPKAFWHIRDLTRDLSLLQIADLIHNTTSITHRERAVLFTYYGFITEEDPVYQAIEDGKFNLEDLDRLAKKIDVALYGGILTETSTGGSDGADETNEKVKSKVFYKLGEKERILHFDSPRIFLYEANALHTPDFLDNLTDQEIKILQLAVALEGHTFLYTNAKITAVLELNNTDYVESTLTWIVKLWKNKEHEFYFVDTDNTRIFAHSAQYQLLFWNRFQPPTNLQLANLSELQRAAYDSLSEVMSEPGKPRRYRSLTAIKEHCNFSDSSIISGIVDSFVNNKLIQELYILLQTALSKEINLTEEQLFCVQYTLQVIEAGRPLQSPKGGFAFQKIADEIYSQFEAQGNLLAKKARFSTLIKKTLALRLEMPSPFKDDDVEEDEDGPTALDLARAEGIIRVVQRPEAFNSGDLHEVVMYTNDHDMQGMLLEYWGADVFKPLLTLEEEYELLTIFKTSDDARQREWAETTLIKRNIRLVLHCIKKFSRISIGSVDNSLLDAVIIGATAISTAAKKFDLSTGNKFSTYATWRIRQAVTRIEMEEGSEIRLPVHMHEKLIKLAKVERFVSSLDGLDPLSEEGTIRVIEVYEEKFKKIITRKSIDNLRGKRKLLGLVEMDKPVNDDVDSDDRHSFIGSASVEETVMSRERIEAINRMLLVLDSREEKIVRLRLGLGEKYGEAMELEPIGKLFGITRERIRQIFEIAIKKLQAYIISLDEDERDDLIDLLAGEAD